MGFLKTRGQEKMDGWLNFFLEFFDIISLDLLVVVEESRAQGKIVGAMNDTFLALVPNSS